MGRVRGAIKISCQFCSKRFWASRVDTKYCSERCRYRSRMEDGKFNCPVIPLSAVPGVTFSRVRKRWEVRIKEEGNHRGWKYVGCASSLKEALEIQQEIMQCQPV